MNFRDVPDGARFFDSDDKLFVKRAHEYYTSDNPNEIPPNAHRPDAPHLYARFGPLAPVTLADSLTMEELRRDFIVELSRQTRQLRKWQDDTIWLWPQDVAQMVLDALRAVTPGETICFGYVKIDRFADLAAGDECALCGHEIGVDAYVALFSDRSVQGPYCALCATGQ